MLQILLETSQYSLLHLSKMFLQNALKFNKPKGTILICVSFNKSTGKLWTFVEDTGIGIEKNQMRSLFIAFRNKLTPKLSFEQSEKSGIGIGLSNSKCLVKALGGQINLESKLGHGTIVSFSVES